MSISLALKLFFGASVLTLLLTPPIQKTAWGIGAVDIPKDSRRMHVQPTPRWGGAAVFSAICISYLFFLTQEFPLAENHALLFSLVGGGLVFFIGSVDDVYALPPWVKLPFQMLASWVAVLGGNFAVGWEFFPAFLWVLTLTNAHNFIDGLDGLLSGTAVLEGLGLFTVLLLQGNAQSAMFALLLSGCCLGFLFFNRHPASIFLGDSGSETLGFLLGMLSLPILQNASTPLESICVLLLFAYPLTDLFASILRRLLQGKSIFSADREHFHHRLCDLGLSQSQTVFLFWILSAMLGAIGILILAGNPVFLTIGWILFTVFSMTRIRKAVFSFKKH